MKLTYGMLVDQVLKKIVEYDLAPKARPIPPDYHSVGWMDMIDALTPAQRRAELLRVKRSRARLWAVEIPGCRQVVLRGALRDYLRESLKPKWLQSRPLPASDGGTIKFRRYIPFAQGSQRREAMLRLRAEGKSYSEIAATYGITKQRVGQIVTRYRPDYSGRKVRA